MSNSIISETGLLIYHLSERIKTLEEKVFGKSKRKVTTRAQQMLLLKYSGMIEIISDMKITKEQKAKFLSILLNGDATNIEDDLSYIFSDDPQIRTKKDFEFLVPFHLKLNSRHQGAVAK